jgi:hypothetical protein
MHLNKAYKYHPQEAAATTLLQKGPSPARTKTDKYSQGSNALTFTIMEEGPQRMHGLVYPETEIINRSLAFNGRTWIRLTVCRKI